MENKIEFQTKTPSQTKKLAKILAKFCANFNGILIIKLFGDLGSGKTTFVKGFAQGLMIKDNILSPTFNILNRYLLKKNGNLYHIDCYRLKNSKDLIKLGFTDMLKENNSIIMIEWAEKIKDFKFKNVSIIKIYFKHQNGNKRKITIKI